MSLHEKLQEVLTKTRSQLQPIIKQAQSTFLETQKAVHPFIKDVEKKLEDCEWLAPYLKHWRSLDQDTQLAYLGSTFLVSLLFIFLIVKFFSTGKSKGDTVLLLGPSGAGKTALFFQLRDGRQPETVTSMMQNEGRFVPFSQASQRKAEQLQPLQFVDFPGHPRLRPSLDKYYSSTLGIVFVVDATDVANQSRLAAEYLYELMSERSLRGKKKLPLLIVCNKSDVPGAASVDSITSKLEREMGQVRKTRAAAVADTAGEVAALTVGRPDKQFEFQHSPFTVSVADASVLTGKIESVVQFLKRVSS